MKWTTRKWINWIKDRFINSLLMMVHSMAASSLALFFLNVFSYNCFELDDLCIYFPVLYSAWYHHSLLITSRLIFFLCEMSAIPPSLSNTKQSAKQKLFVCLFVFNTTDTYLLGLILKCPEPCVVSNICAKWIQYRYIMLPNQNGSILHPLYIAANDYSSWKSSVKSAIFNYGKQSGTHFHISAKRQH